MRKILAIVLIMLLLLATCSIAETRSIDLDTMSVEELTALSKEIAKAIAQKNATIIDGYISVTDYGEYARNPDAHEGEKITFDGTVVQVSEGIETTTYRIAMDDDGDEVFYVSYSPSIEAQRILEDDKVTVTGTFDGLYDYTSVLGGLITVPACTANLITEKIKPLAEYAATRQDPAPIGATIRYEGSSYRNDAVTDFTITKVVRGDAAYKMVRGFNSWNDKPKKGQEYIVVYVHSSVISSKNDQAASIYDGDFTFVSEDGIQYDDTYISGVTPALKDLYPGAEYEGIVVCMINKDDKPCLIYLASSDNPIWFDLNKRKPMVWDDSITLVLLEKGSKGDDVMRLQEKLVELGYLSGTPDGDFGNKTKEAISKYQKDNGIEETGIADIETQKQIFMTQK